MDFDKLKEDLAQISDKVSKHYTSTIEADEEVQKVILDTIALLSAKVATDVIFEYEKLKSNQN